MMRTGPGDANDRTTVQLRDPLVGTVLDRRFRIDFQLAAGGFGAIYQATDVHSNVEVALKVLHAKLARDPNVIERFRREAATLSNLRDPHTIRAFEFGEASDGTLYIVMELLHGESLYQQFHAHGPMPWRRVVHIARGVCSSLAEAHACGIVHRDLKPANIHLETRDADTDFVKVLDFGIAKIVHGGGQERTELTQAGQMIGTVDYMSPEQMVGGEMTGRSDIYTLGTVIYEMITGRMPFADAQTATAILAAVLTRTPEPVSHHTPVPPALDEIVARCLERDPQKRYVEISELDEALARVAAMGLGRSSAPPRLELADRPTTAYARQTPVEPSTGLGVALQEPTDVLTSAPVRPPPVELAGPARPADLAFGAAARPTPAEVLARSPAGSTPLEVVGRADVWPRAAVPSSGFEQPSPTSEATRIDVRFTDSSQPVLDARGPRYRLPEGYAPPEPPLVAPAATPQANPSPIAGAHQPVIGHARGSQQGIEPRAWQPPVGRASPPMVDHAAHPARPVRHPAQPVIPPPLRAGNYPPRSYDMAALTSHDAIVRRIIWISVLAAVIVAIVIATH
jgi:serine/threonine protein kinase